MQVSNVALIPPARLRDGLLLCSGVRQTRPGNPNEYGGTVTFQSTSMQFWGSLCVLGVFDSTRRHNERLRKPSGGCSALAKGLDLVHSGLWLEDLVRGLAPNTVLHAHTRPYNGGE